MPYLLEDFQGRCAYSRMHHLRHGNHEVDHFNPELTGARRNRYSNLLPAIRHCNGKKSNIWPSKSHQRAGIRFLDPSKEQDYDVHIFEDPETHDLVGVTLAGKWQIEICDLNAPFLVEARKERAELRELLESRSWRPKPSRWNRAPEIVERLEKLFHRLEQMIPPIKPPPSRFVNALNRTTSPTAGRANT